MRIFAKLNCKRKFKPIFTEPAGRGRMLPKTKEATSWINYPEPSSLNESEAIQEWKAACISCNQCLDEGYGEEGIYCVVERKIKEKRNELR